MKIRTVKYFLSEGVSNLWRNRVMTFASVTAVVVSLTILGIFTLIVMNVDHMASQVESKLVLNAYINENVNEKDIPALESTVKEISGVKSIRYVSKKQALEDYKKQLGKQAYLLNGLEKDNPLPRSFIVKVSNVNKIKSVAKSLSGIKSITNVNYGSGIVDKLLKFTRVIRLVGIVFITILALVAVIIISNTIKIAVYARRREVNIMKYIGATDWFIRWPFIIEGLILGLLGSIVAIAIVAYTYYYFTSRFSNQLALFSLISYDRLIPDLTKLTLLLGCAIGVLGSGISLRKFLRV